MAITKASFTLKGSAGVAALGLSLVAISEELKDADNLTIPSRDVTIDKIPIGNDTFKYLIKVSTHETE